MHYTQITYEVTLISSDHYKNRSVIVDLAMGQIPRSTERISSERISSSSYVTYFCAISALILLIKCRKEHATCRKYHASKLNFVIIIYAHFCHATRGGGITGHVMIVL